MDDYISRAAALREVCLMQCNDTPENCELTECKNCGNYSAFLAIPPADVRPVVRGEWTDKRTLEHDGEWYCTACGKGITIYMGPDRKDRYAFCPNCGADMRPAPEPPKREGGADG